MKFRQFILILFLTILSFYGKGQPQPIGSWSAHLPFGSAIAVADTGASVVCASPYGIFFINKADNTLEKLTKVNGLTETRIRSMAWSSGSNALLIAYNNGRLDVLREHKSFTINDIYNSPIQQSKIINSIYCNGELAYLATNYGILVADPVKAEIKESFVIGNGGIAVPVAAVCVLHDTLFAACGEAVKYVGLATGNPSDFSNWTTVESASGLPAGPASLICNWEETVYAVRSDSIYRRNANGSWQFIYNGSARILSLQPAPTGLLITESMTDSGRVSLLDDNGNIIKQWRDAYYTRVPVAALETDGDYWIADSLHGLSKYSNQSFAPYAPNAPLAPALGDGAIKAGLFWITAGAFTSAGNSNGLYQYKDNSWTSFDANNLPALDSLPAINSAAIDPVDGSLWAGSLGGGLLHLAADRTVQVYKQSSGIQPVPNSGQYNISSLCFDDRHNLWMANPGAGKPLLVKTEDGQWNSYPLPFPLNGAGLGQLICNNNDQVWMIAGGNQGLLCFSNAGSITNTGDDQWRIFREGKGKGNLPSDDVRCIALDKDHFIWVGTGAGIAVIPCTDQIFQPGSCEASIPVVQDGNINSYLFADQIVQTIAVDGANRKWVGTQKGAWLISADGLQTIAHFTSANSPLPSDNIKHIFIDPQSGEVYFASTNGICSYRSTATEGESVQAALLVFPNPVPPGYTGTIAIRGLASNSLVKITELDGRLVFQTRALGGQAVWNGKDPRGNRAASGVYLILTRTEDGREKLAGKIVFIRQ